MKHKRKHWRQGSGAFSPKELADHWGKSRQHIYNLINAGKLHSFKLGRSRLIPVSEVQRIESGDQ